MAERQVKTTPFLSGQQTNAKPTGPTKTTLKVKMAKERNIGQPDALSQALKGRDSYIPGDLHKFSHTKTVASRGAHYSPAGEYGRPSGKLGSRATGMGPHTSRPGQNALGVKQNLKGGNPLGNPENKRGLNVLGGHGGSGTFRGRP
jgi:hypothetical protein